jgi:hypothetical protein
MRGFWTKLLGVEDVKQEEEAKLLRRRRRRRRKRRRRRRREETQSCKLLLQQIHQRWQHVFLITIQRNQIWT